MTNNCAICAIISSPVAAQKIQMLETSILAPTRHVGAWTDLTQSEQLAILGLMSDELSANTHSALSFDTHSVNAHFYIRLNTATISKSPQPSEPARLISGGSDALFPHLQQQIDQSTNVDLAIAFAMQSGVSMLSPYLQDLLDRSGRIRLVVGDYFDVTEPVALRQILDLNGNIERYVFETNGGSFHPKAWVFHGANEQGSAIVGSSNLTRTALLDGIEWNFQTSTESADWLAVRSAFDSLIKNPKVKPLTHEWVKTYENRRSSKPPTEMAKTIVKESPPAETPKAHAIQRDALAALEATRTQGYQSGLVVLATGLGKTWLSAFDSLQFKRVLFVAHREEILNQAMSTFRKIRPQSKFGLYNGTTKEFGEVVFASIQTIGQTAHLSNFAPNAFDYIVVDEFHHAAARSYQALLKHFKPTFLLGLTATPERTDGGDLLSLCGENLVFHCDLFEGIESGLLAPFHYFGVPDEVDYAQIPWRNNKFDEEELTKALATQARAQNALEQFRKHANGPAIGFCCSKLHADFMSSYFKSAGYRSVAVHSGETSAPRTTSLEALAKGDLDILFAVDMFNEGVDVPSIGAVLMLRPTESALLFLQQLGRGLRRSEGKTHLNVIDYIGNHRNFLTKARALLAAGEGDKSLSLKLDELEKMELDLPPGCEITYELKAIDLLRSLINPTSTQTEAEAFYRDFRLRHGTRPTASEMAQADFEPSQTGHGAWFNFVADMGDEVPDTALVTHRGFLDAIERGKFESPDPLLILAAEPSGITTGINRQALFGATRTLSKHKFGIQEFSEVRFEKALSRWVTSSYLQDTDGIISLTRSDKSGSLPSLMEELVSWRLIKLAQGPARAAVGVNDKSADFEGGPQIWKSYMREEISQLFGVPFSPGNWNAGIVRVPNGLVLLTTLDKGALSVGGHYEDGFVDPQTMKWQSQSRTTQDSEHGRILSGKVIGQNVYLFVRGSKLRDSKAAPFIYCGQPQFAQWEGERPITITWKLESPVPEHLRKMLAVHTAK